MSHNKNEFMGLEKAIEEIVDRAEPALRSFDGKNYGADHLQVKQWRAALVAGGVDEDIAIQRARRATLVSIIYSTIKG